MDIKTLVIFTHFYLLVIITYIGKKKLISKKCGYAGKLALKNLLESLIIMPFLHSFNGVILP